MRGASPSSFRHDKARLLGRRRLLTLLVVFFILMLFLRTPLSTFAAAATANVLRPIFVLQNGLTDTLSSYGYFFSSKKILTEENARLQGALDTITLEAFSRDALRRENDTLKNVLSRHPERNLLLARVLVSAPHTPYDTLVIDVGARDGIITGMSVFVDGDFVLGEVTQVFLYSAIVTLYSSSGNELVALLGASSTQATAYGVGGGSFRVTLPRGVEVVTGDLVELPMLAPTYLGVVDAVVSGEGSSLQEIHFRWPLNIATLRYVYIDAPTSASSTRGVSPATP